jgi:hypothetical protein
VLIDLLEAATVAAANGGTCCCSVGPNPPTAEGTAVETEEELPLGNDSNEGNLSTFSSTTFSSLANKPSAEEEMGAIEGMLTTAN